MVILSSPFMSVLSLVPFFIAPRLEWYFSTIAVQSGDCFRMNKISHICLYSMATPPAETSTRSPVLIPSFLAFRN